MDDDTTFVREKDVVLAAVKLVSMMVRWYDRLWPVTTKSTAVQDIRVTHIQNIDPRPSSMQGWQRTALVVDPTIVWTRLCGLV